MTLRAIVVLTHSKCGSLLVLTVATLALAGLFAALPLSATAAQSTTNVTIQNYAFKPGNVTVVIGENNTVTWTNNDSVTHTVTADDSSFGGTIAAGATFTHTFTTAGVYTYHCAIHPFMKGTVTVLSAGSSSTTSTTGSPPTSTSFTTTLQSVTTQSSPPTTTTTTPTAAVPEFPFGTVAVVAITALVIASYVAVRRRS